MTIMWILPAIHDSWNWWRFARWFTNPHTWCKSKPSMKPWYRQRGAWKLMWNPCTKQCYFFVSFHFLQFPALRWPEWFSNIPSGGLTQQWKITIFKGKIRYKWPFSIAMLVHQRVFQRSWVVPLSSIHDPWHPWSMELFIDGATTLAQMGQHMSISMESPSVHIKNNWDLWMFIPPFSLVISELVTFDYQKNYPNYYPTWTH